MDGDALIPDDILDPPPRLFERLHQIAGYTWDESVRPFHSTYDFWHVTGTRHVSSRASTSTQNVSSPGSVTRAYSSGASPSEQPNSFDYSTSASSQTQTQQSQTQSQTSSPPSSDIQYAGEELVIARISRHGLREERAFQTTKKLTTTVDPTGAHIVKPIDLIRLAPQPGDRGTITVAIYRHIGPNYLNNVLDMGPAFYHAEKQGDTYRTVRSADFKLQPPITLQRFLDFAIGATECLEILHHNECTVHGEIRGDAFHYNIEENKVRVASFGSGARTFEHGLTSSGWATLSKELGAKTKLLYIGPEQTARMAAQPDSRTDIYSLGILCWMLLTQKPVFDGETPFDIVQAVLSRKIPNVSDLRIDIPDVIGRIIQKCTSKNMADRYNSASGLRYDLVKVQDLLGQGDWEALNGWEIGTHDISSVFMLPNVMIGRQKERSDLVKVIDRVAKTHHINRKGLLSRFSDGTNLTDVTSYDDVSSEGASSGGGTNQRSDYFMHTATSDPSKNRGLISAQQSFQSDTNTISGDTISSTQSGMTTRVTRPWERHQSISMETHSLVDSVGTTGTDGNRQSIGESTSSSLSRQLGNAKFRRRGHCEVVTIEGAGGLGKSSLVQSVLAEARRRGYCATAKFDTSRRAAFGPLLKLLSSLFKQVWGERNTETPFHQKLKQYIRPVWPMLHKVLELPEFLLGPPDSSLVVPRSIGASSTTSSSRHRTRPSGARRGSSPDTSPAPLGRTSATSAAHSQSCQDFLRAGASTKTMRLMNTFLDVLRVFTSHKFICFCLDDLHFADDESLELISQIIGARMKMAIIITYRPDELSTEKMQGIIHPPESDEFPRSSQPTVTRIPLAPLGEDDIVEYVSTTLCRPRNEVFPLALVIQSKTAGNPFYIREMLGACYRKQCIWYRDSKWHYDLDRLFVQFRGQKDFDVLDTSFITQRLDELPVTARSLLAWAALLGNSFSFELICRLMGGEFDYKDEQWTESCLSKKTGKGYSQAEAIAGLQAAVQAYIIVASEQEDRFRFAHDRYVHAAAALKECSHRRMHFIIAQTLLKYHADDYRLQNTMASHICESLDIIKRRVKHRRRFRNQLIDCAKSSTENGARPTAAKYYKAAVTLLQEDPWNEGAEDVFYAETIQLYLRSAECHLFMSNHQSAHDLLTVIFKNAKTAIDKAPAFVLQSRIFSQNGNAQAAVVSLKECLETLDVGLDEEPTFEKCDRKFEQLSVQIQSMDRSTLLNLEQASDPTLASVGAVLSETASAAWWSDCLRYYHLALVMVETHLTKGAFPQSGMAFLHMSVIALARFNMTKFAVDLGEISQDLLNQAKDTFSIARGLMLYPLLVGHVYRPMPVSMVQMEDAVEFASISGDRMSTILSYGLFAFLKFFASENLTDLEAYASYGCEEIPNWYYDTRGGALLLVMRQVSRALQGKTRVQEPLDVLSDEQHTATTYKNWLMSRTQHSNRSTLLYESLELVPLFLYGHYERAVEIGKRCVDNISMLWSVRNTKLILLFYGLARTGQLLRHMQDPRGQSADFETQREEVIRELRQFTKDMEDWSSVSNVNYFAWYNILEAQTAELTQNHGDAVQHYEQALDHASEHDFVFEEALANYLMAGFFLRRKARRCARSALLDAVGSFRQIAATGVASAIEEEHSLLLHGPTRNHRTADSGVQTDFVTDTAPMQSMQYRAVDGEVGAELTQTPSHNMTELKGERLGAWRTSTSKNMSAEAGANLPALDMIDLHAILVSSQVISSVLKINELLKTMCDVILQTCGGSASLAAIVVKVDKKDEWCVAASGNPEKGATAHKDGQPLSKSKLIVENVVLYCTRFMETVFVSDLISDERFGNVSGEWLVKNPGGRAIIAIPIKHGEGTLHGVLYLEGEPGSFTDRNVSVLQLLVMQLGISYSNAVAMKNVEKISAENESMVGVQKQALQKAKEAETKAKHAETEAMRNVKLAEEAAKAKAIFLANVSHELRTPLNGVIGNSELLRDSNLNREQLEMADSIRVSADLLLTVINDILDFSKMEADKMKLYIIAFNPEEMVREVVRAVSYSNREKTSKKNVKIIQDINLPPMLIYGDPIRLHQVMGNLIGNSLKFTEDGSITIGARLDSETKEKATLTFWVRDTGIGIPPQQLAKLFQPFSQADASTARKYGGSGLGLSICKSLIEIMMQGKIQLESRESIGTTAWFTVSFDKAKADATAGDAQAKSTPGLDRTNSMGSVTGAVGSINEVANAQNSYLDLSAMSKDDVRICVAEDNPINQKIAIQYVQRLGYTNVSAYENGLKAVEGLRLKANEGKPYHIVLMDVQMPVLDGYEATKLIRKDPIEAVRKILVIAMTASAIQGDREKCLAAGMNDYLAKPVRSEVLKKKLDAYLSAQQSSFLESARRTQAPAPAPAPAPKSEETKSQGQVEVIDLPQSKPQPPEMTVSDPMRDDAVFNQPLDTISLTAMDFPMFENPSSDGSKSIPGKDYPIRSASSTSLATSTDNRASNAGSANEDPSSEALKRQPRKLVKNRGNGEAIGIQPAIDNKPARERSNSRSADRPSGILAKKVPQPRGSQTPTEDGDGSETPTSTGVKDELSRDGSAPQQPSPLQDGTSPN